MADTIIAIKGARCLSIDNIYCSSTEMALRVITIVMDDI